MSIAQAVQPTLKLSKLVDRRTRRFNAVSLFTGMGHDASLYMLLQYRKDRVLAYDNEYDKEYIHA